MALTLNRQNEITKEELDFIKKKFNKKTNTQAIYACIKHFIYESPNFEIDVQRLSLKLKDIAEKHKLAFEKIKGKYCFYKECENIIGSLKEVKSN